MGISSNYWKYTGMRYLVGIDEAGRGPVAGPVMVGVVVMPIDAVPEGAFRDSKGLSQSKREHEFARLTMRAKAGELRYAVAQTSAITIDRIGIVKAVAAAMKCALSRLSIDPRECLVLLDGGLRAPKVFQQQETIIKGDEKVYVIALASIVAKVTRDAYMRRASARFPQYGFERHKGYGTREHYNMLKKHGVCAIHRQSFLKNLTDEEVGVEL